MKRNKGISLIVLVITIIVMIILAGAIIITLNNNGIIDKASEAVKEYNLDEVEQVASLAWAEAYLNGARTQQELETAVKNALTANKITEANYDGYELEVTENGVSLEKIIAPGLYTSSDYSVMSISWDALVEDKVVYVNNGVVTTNYDSNEDVNSSSDILNGDLVLPYDGSITSIGENAFYYCENLTSVIIPDGVTSIGEYAFAECRNILTSVVVPDSMTSIGESAFAYSGLKSVVIPDSVKSIENDAFYGCDFISIDIPDSVTSIGEYAFGECYYLTSIVIPDGVTSIGNSTFSMCTDLTSIVIPDSVTSIGGAAFEGCHDLTSVTFNGTVSQWNAITFDEDWNYACREITVACTDGTIIIPAH